MASSLGNGTVLVAMLLVLTTFAPPSMGVTITASDTVHGNALAVGSLPDGELVGVTAGVQAMVLADGEGQVFIDTKPLAQTDMQGSARLAARVAGATVGVPWQEYDYLLVFRSGSPVVGGPSAGSIMSLVMSVALHNVVHPDDPWHVDPRFAATGTINPDGTIGPVGGIPEKIRGAQRADMDSVMYPSGQTLTQDGGGNTVDLRGLCDELDIRCRPATSVVDLIEGATGITVERVQETVPDTSSYGDHLRPSVADQVDSLATLLASLPQGDGSSAAADMVEEAETRLTEARQALAGEFYYTAATKAFQGRIFARQADLLLELSASSVPSTVAEAAFAECDDAVADVLLVLDADPPRHANALYAIGAAQVRVLEAQSLAESARVLLEGAGSIDDLARSVQQSAFCIERAGTVTWWAGLVDLFGRGPVIEDLDGIAQDIVERSRDMVAYVEAVTDAASPAGQLFAQATEQLDQGRPAAAIVRALEAEARANLVLQTTTGTLSDAILNEAQQNAARAVAAARDEGIEPILSVAQVELSLDLAEPGSALESLWTARSLALVLVTDPAPAASFGPIRTVSYGDPLQDLGAGMAMGAFVGASVLAVMALVGLATRRIR